MKQPAGRAKAIQVLAFSIIFCFPVLFFGVALTAAQTAQTASDQAQATSAAQAPEQQPPWAQDLDKKLDKTIEIMKILKDEMKDVKLKPTGTEAQKVTGAAGTGVVDKAWLDNLKTIIARLSSFWTKADKVVEPETADKDAAAREKQVADWSKNMSDKLTSAIEAMKVIKEEVEKMPETQNAGTTQK